MNGKLRFLSVIILIPTAAQAQNIAINKDAAVPDNSVMLGIKSTAKGMLLPERNLISNPAGTQFYS